MNIVRALIFTSAIPIAICQTPNGSDIYRRACSTCHEQSNIERMPQRSVIARMSPENVLAVLNNGVMQSQAAGLAMAERRAVAEYLTGKTIGAETQGPPKNICTTAPGDLRDPLSGSVWNGWGVDSNNSRFQPNPGFSAADIPKL